MLIRGYNDIKLGSTTADWSLTRIIELLVPAQKGLTQFYLAAQELSNVHSALALNSALEFRYMEGYF